MDRTTIMLPPELKSRAVQTAREQGISLGEFIRKALNSLLHDTEKERGDDSLMVDHSVYTEDAPDDLSEKHDEYLYGKHLHRDQE